MKDVTIRQLNYLSSAYCCKEVIFHLIVELEKSTMIGESAASSHSNYSRLLVRDCWTVDSARSNLDFYT